MSAFQVECLTTGAVKTFASALPAELFRIAQVQRGVTRVDVHADEFLGRNADGKPALKWFDLKLHKPQGAIYWHAVDRPALMDSIRREREEVARGRGCELRLWTYTDLYGDPVAFVRAKARHHWLTHRPAEDLKLARDQIIATVQTRSPIDVASLAFALQMRVETVLVASLQLWIEGKVDELASSPVSPRLVLVARHA